jgi:hypothetical protein
MAQQDVSPRRHKWNRKDLPNVVEGWLASVDEITLLEKENPDLSLNRK